MQLWGIPGSQEPRVAPSTPTTLDPFVAKIVAVSVDTEGLRTDTYVIFDDPAAAEANVDRITTIARQEPPDSRPWDNTSPGAVVARSGNVVQTTIRGFNSGIPTPVAE